VGYEEEPQVPRGTAGIDSEDDRDMDDGDGDASDSDGEAKPLARGTAAEPDSDDDDVDDEEEQQVAGSKHASSKAFDIDNVKEQHFLTYGKKTFGTPSYAYVILGTPFPCADGKEMGHILASKAPEQWSKIKSKHIYVLNADGQDYFYVCFYVAGSPTENIDIRRLFPVHRPVCKGLVDRFNLSNISDARKVQIARIMNFRVPPEECGPQIDPRAMRWDRYLVEAGSIPTEKVAPTSTPRPLKSKRSTSPSDAPRGPIKSLMASKPKKSADGGSSSRDVLEPAAPPPVVAPKPKADKKRPAAAMESPRDDGSSTSTHTQVVGNGRKKPAHLPNNGLLEWNTEGANSSPRTHIPLCYPLYHSLSLCTRAHACMHQAPPLNVCDRSTSSSTPLSATSTSWINASSSRSTPNLALQ